jgi:hypothetical protein
MAALWWHMSRFTNVCVSNETYICHRWCCDRRMFANTNMGVHLHLRAQYDVWNIGRLAARMSAKGREDPHKDTFGSGSRRCQGVLCMCVVVVLVSSTHQTRPDPCCSVGGMLLSCCLHGVLVCSTHQTRPDPCWSVGGWLFAYWVFVVLVCCCCLVVLYLLCCLIKNCFVLCCVVLCCVDVLSCLVLYCHEDVGIQIVVSFLVLSCDKPKDKKKDIDKYQEIENENLWSDGMRTTHPIRFHRTNLIPTLILLLSCMSESNAGPKTDGRCNT